MVESGSRSTVANHTGLRGFSAAGSPLHPKWRPFHVHCFESHRHESRAAQRSSLIAGFPLRLGGLGGALEQAGVPLVAIQQYLGHADMAMTMRYSHLSPAARQDYIKVLDGAR